MNVRFGLVVVAALAMAAGACAGGGGVGTDTPAAAPSGGGEVLRQGESPRENEMTETAAEHIEMAEEAESEEAARPHWQQALDAAQQAIAADSTNPLPHLQAGVANMGLRNWEAADEMLTRAEELRPIYQLQITPMREQQWINLYQTGAPLVNQGQFEEALPYFEGADALYEQRPEAKLALGQIYSQLGRYDDAVESFQGALDFIEGADYEQVDSATAASWQETAETLPLQIAQGLMNAQRYAEAAGILREEAEAAPDNTILARTLASLYVQMEQPDSAAVAYRRLLERTDLTGEDYYSAGIGFYQIEEYQEAADAFADAVELNGTDRDAAEMLARSLQIAFPPGEGNETPPERLEQLHAAATLWNELDPMNPNSYLVLAQTESRMGNQERAGELVRAREAMEVGLDNLALRRRGDGSAVVSGQLTNFSAEPGQTATLEVSFYGEDGSVIGTGQAMIRLPAQDANELFQVEYTGTEEVTGYTYELTL